MIPFQDIFKELSKTRLLFHSKADLLHSFAWEIQNKYPDSSLRLGKAVAVEREKAKLDVLVHLENKNYAVKLHYLTKSFEYTLDDEDYCLEEHGKQVENRYDVVNDLYQLEQVVHKGIADVGVLLFLTNDAAYFEDFTGARIPDDHDFRLHEGKELAGKLQWRNPSKLDVLKGREQSITLRGRYNINWQTYSKIDSSFRGDFRYIFLSIPENVEDVLTFKRDDVVNDEKPKEVVNEKTSTIETPAPKKEHTSTVEKPNIQDKQPEASIEMKTNLGVAGPTWFKGFVEKKIIPNSQFDLRDKLVDHLRGLGYSIDISKWFGMDKVDLVATKDEERIAIEVRFATARLQKMYEGSHLYFRDHGAYPQGRYDYLKDLAKVERVVKHTPGMKGYTILITNDHLYWKPSRKENPVDKDFHIYDGREVTGICKWSEEASFGTISGRKEPIILEGSYPMKWQPYVQLGNEKNEEFRVLINEVAD